MTNPRQNSDYESSTAASDDKFRSLMRTEAFPVQVEFVELRQTHISEVFLGGTVVYKVKKPVKLPFLDFSTPSLRHHFCNEEVRINSPWAPGVYHGVVPVTVANTEYHFEGHGEVVDWAVKMTRLPESATLRSRLNRGELEPGLLQYVARRIAEIHGRSKPASGDDSRNAVRAFRSQLNDNWQFAEQLPESIIDAGVLARIRNCSENWLSRCDDLLLTRAQQGLIREVHGDLRLEHVFCFPESPPPGDIVILDGIEFDPGLRRIDVVADMAFLTMELSFLGRGDLANIFAEAYFTASEDLTGKILLPLYAAYRSAVRAKVAAIVGSEREISQADRTNGLARSRSHWLWCLSELETPGGRPGLILVSGLPGTGKSTLSRSLAERAHFEVIRSDVVRKEIFAEESSGQTSSLYTSNRTQQIYDECLERARRLLQIGRRVIVDATFQREQDRQNFLQLAIECGARAVWLECVASPEITKQRIEARHGDASDADWSVYQLVRSRWQPPSEMTVRYHEQVDTTRSGDAAADESIRILSRRQLADQ
jgi:aminoglycoside phosphotransferase family enzyme/predicted kinase